MTALLEPQDTVETPPPAAGPVEAGPVEARPAPAETRPVPASAVAPAAAPAAVAVAAPGRVRVLLSARPVLTPAWVRFLGVVLVGLFAAMVAIEPSPDGPQPVPVLSTWDETLLTVQSLAMFAALAGFAMGRRWALKPALVFAGFCAWGVATCPTSGHHVVAGWWFAQVALAAAMVLIPVLALLRTRARR